MKAYSVDFIQLKALLVVGTSATVEGFYFLFAVFEEIPSVPSALSSEILGPLGALVIALIAAYILYRFVNEERKKNENLVREIIDEKDVVIKALEERIKAQNETIRMLKKQLK